MSFSAEPHDSSSKQSSHKNNNSFSELVEFQATINMPTDDAANHSCNNESSNIVIMEDTEQLNGKSVTGHHRVVKDLASLLDRGN